MQQPRALLGGRAVGRRAVGSVNSPVAEALDPRVVVERAAAADGVAQPVGERADAGAGHVGLRRLDEPGVVGDLAEVPALAVEVDLLAVDAVVRERQRVERSAHVQHVRPSSGGPSGRSGSRRPCTRCAQVTSESIISFSIIACSVAVFAQQVEVSTDPVGREPVVVAGDDPVEHRLRVLAGRGGVVVDHVHHHPQAGAVDALRPSRGTRACAPRPSGVGGVGALRRRVVQRVVAPVEAVGVLDQPDARPAGPLLAGGERRAGRTAAAAASSGPPRSSRCRSTGSRCTCSARPRRARAGAACRRCRRR